MSHLRARPLVCTFSRHLFIRSKNSDPIKSLKKIPLADSSREPLNVPQDNSQFPPVVGTRVNQRHLISSSPSFPAIPEFYEFVQQRFFSPQEIFTRAAQILLQNKKSKILLGTDAQFIRELLAYHPAFKRKVGSGISALLVKPLQVGSEDYSFFIRRPNGEEEPFSVNFIVKNMKFRNGAEIPETVASLGGESIIPMDNYRRRHHPVPLVAGPSPASVTHPAYQPPANLAYRSRIDSVMNPSSLSHINPDSVKVVTGPHAPLIAMIFSSEALPRSQLIQAIDELSTKHADLLTALHWERMILILHSLGGELPRAKAVEDQLAQRGIFLNDAFYFQLMEILSFHHDFFSCFSYSQCFSEKYSQWTIKGFHCLLLSLQGELKEKQLYSIKWNSKEFPEEYKKPIESIFSMIEDYEKQPVTSIFYRSPEVLMEILRLSCRLQEFSRANGFFYRILSKIPQVSLEFYHSHMESMILNRQFTELPEILKKMLENHYFPTKSTYFLLIRAQYAAENIEKAMEILDLVENLPESNEENNKVIINPYSEKDGNSPHSPSNKGIPYGYKYEQSSSSSQSQRSYRNPSLNTFYFYCLDICRLKKNIPIGNQLWKRILEKNLLNSPGFLTPQLLYSVLRIGITARAPSTTINMWKDMVKFFDSCNNNPVDSSSTEASGETKKPSLSLKPKDFLGDFHLAAVFSAFSTLGDHKKIQETLQYCQKQEIPLNIESWAIYQAFSIKKQQSYISFEEFSSFSPPTAASTTPRGKILEFSKHYSQLLRKYGEFALSIEQMEYQLGEFRKKIEQLEKSEKIAASAATGEKKEEEEGENSSAAPIDSESSDAVEDENSPVGPFYDRFSHLIPDSSFRNSIFTSFYPHCAEIRTAQRDNQFFSSPASVFLVAMELFAIRRAIRPFYHCWDILISHQWLGQPEFHSPHYFAALKGFSLLNHYELLLLLLEKMNYHHVWIQEKQFHSLLMIFIGNEINIRLKAKDDEGEGEKPIEGEKKGPEEGGGKKKGKSLKEFPQVKKKESRYSVLFDKINREYDAIRQETAISRDFHGGAVRLVKFVLERFQKLDPILYAKACVAREARQKMQFHAFVKEKPKKPKTFNHPQNKNNGPIFPVIRYGDYDLVKLCRSRSLNLLSVDQLKEIQSSPDLMAGEPLDNSEKLIHVRTVSDWLEKKIFTERTPAPSSSQKANNSEKKAEENKNSSKTSSE